MAVGSRLVAVTGAGQGIGRAIAIAFAAGGDEVLVLDRDGEAAAECRQEVAAAGGRARAAACDVSRPAEVEAAFAAAGRCDVLVCNAGIGGPGIRSGDLSDWERVLATNLTGAYVCCRAAAPLMRAAGGGAIVLISSTRALQSEPDSEPYAASKAGLLGLTHALAASLGPDGIRVNAICPGWIDTATHLPFARRHEPVHSEADRRQHWVGRVGRPEDVAAACRFLCDPAAGFITGQHLVIDGGMTRRMIYA
jgi:NAD(P)-dependent dehydrogenase (short-subunit alcohol dehydrogenase family)